MALAWALEPSAESRPSGQLSPEPLPPSEPEAGCADPLGSEPHAARPKVARAARAANESVRVARRFVVMYVPHRHGACAPGVNSRARVPAGWSGGLPRASRCGERT